MQSRAIGIDLGGTHIKGVLMDQSGNIFAEARNETREHDSTHWKPAVAEMIRELKSKEGAEVHAIGLSAPGLADAGNNFIACMPGRLAGLENFVWSEFIGDKVWVLNDAHAALMAEAAFGVAKGLRHAVILTLGTGVGGGILIDGKLYQGVSQMAGHIGHTTVNADSPKLDTTNMPGSIEDAIGNATLEERSGGKYRSTRDLVMDVKAGDPFAIALWESSVRKLAVCLASVINILSPEVIILGGGLAQADELLLGPLQNFLDLYEWRPGGKKTPVKMAQFSDRAGAIGAAGFAFSKMKP